MNKEVAQPMAGSSQARDVARRFDVLWWPFIVLALASPCIIGTVGSIGSVVVALLALPVVLDRQGRRELQGQWGVLVFPISFVVLGIMFAINASELADMRFLFNFTSLPLAGPAFILARRHAGGKWPLIIVSLALAGATLGAAAGAYDVFIAGQRRATGLFNNPNMYAHIILLFGFMSLAGVFMSRSIWRFVFLAGPFLGLAGTILSGSRGTALAVPALVFIALVYLLTRPVGRRWVLAGLAVATVGALGWLTLMANTEGGFGRVGTLATAVTEVLTTGESSDNSTQTRLRVYKAAWFAFMDEPVRGYGWADAIPAANSYLSASNEVGFPHMHNDFLGFAVGAGIAGLVVYFAMLLAPFANLDRHDPFFAHRAYIAVLLVSSYAIYGAFDAMFGFDTGISTYAFLTAILAGSFVTRRSPQP